MFCPRFLRHCATLLIALSVLSPAAFARTENAQLTVTCDSRMGPASQIEDFLGAGGGFYYVSSDPANPVVKAWRWIGMKWASFETLHVEDPAERWIVVTRDAGGKIHVDFSDYDRYVRSYLENLQAKLFVYLGGVPRPLSMHPEDKNYHIYLPRDLDEWEQFVFTVVHHNVADLGLRGLTYGCLGEPDHIDSWRGSGSGIPAQTLREHVELYAATYRGVKAADPTAKIGGPSTMSWKATKWTRNPPFVLADWIRELARYNTRTGLLKMVGLDYISWQDYGWAGENLSDGADAVSQFLRENGFDPKTPKMLVGSGWGSWGSDYLDDDMRSNQRASYVAHNFLREFRDPRQRKFAQAIYYNFFFNDDWLIPGDYDTEIVGRPSLVRLSKSGKLSLSSSYAVFEMMSGMIRGDIVESATPSDNLEILATRDDLNQTIVIAVNNHSRDAAKIELNLNGVPFKSGWARCGIRRIDSHNSHDGQGLQKPTGDWFKLTNGELRFPLDIDPYGTIQIAISPA